MHIINKTPFKADAGMMFDHTGENIISFAVKASFVIPDNDKPAKAAQNQTEVFISDQPFDKTSNSNIRYPADTVLKKENTDIILNGTVYSPKPVKRIPALVRVDNYYKIIEAVGNRIYKRRLSTIGFKITEPEPFLEMPITCNRLYGGPGFAENPHGTGFVKDKYQVNNMPLPNFENPKQKITSYKKQYTPASFGCAGPAAEHRRKYAGTYDKNYKETQFPLFPEDLDARFFNTARPELITKGFLKGGEQVLLKNLSKKGEIGFQLPVYSFSIIFDLAGEKIIKKPDLCTVLIEPDHERFYMTWGCSLVLGNRPSKLKYIKLESKEI